MTRSAACLLAFLAAAGTTRIVEAQSQSAQAAFKRAGVFLVEARYDEAIAGYTEAIRLDPTYEDAYVDRGYEFVKKGKVKQAIADENEALRLEPDDPLAFYARGAAYLREGLYARAIADETESIRLEPSHIAYVARGDAYAKAQNDDPAIADYDEALRLNPNDSQTFKNRALLYKKKRDRARAPAKIAAIARVNKPSVGRPRTKPAGGAQSSGRSSEPASASVAKPAQNTPTLIPGLFHFFAIIVVIALLMLALFLFIIWVLAVKAGLSGS